MTDCKRVESSTGVVEWLRTLGALRPGVRASDLAASAGWREGTGVLAHRADGVGGIWLLWRDEKGVCARTALFDDLGCLRDRDWSEWGVLTPLFDREVADRIAALSADTVPECAVARLCEAMKTWSGGRTIDRIREWGLDAVARTAVGHPSTELDEGGQGGRVGFDIDGDLWIVWPRQVGLTGRRIKCLNGGGSIDRVNQMTWRVVDIAVNLDEAACDTIFAHAKARLYQPGIADVIIRETERCRGTTLLPAATTPAVDATATRKRSAVNEQR